jgi:molybdopterin-guanine dinucleotide biosynthesis protein A
MPPDPTAAAILAGGQARRFGGRDKSRLVVEGLPIIVREVDVLQRVATEVFIVASDVERFADLGLPVHADRVPGAGPLGGVYTALDAAQADLVITVACDLPFLHEGLLRRLIDLASAADGAWVRSEPGVEPLIACYRRSARVPIREAIAGGRLTMADLGSILRMAEMPVTEVERFGPRERLLANINTPEDYARVQ